MERLDTKTNGLKRWCIYGAPATAESHATCCITRGRCGIAKKHASECAGRWALHPASVEGCEESARPDTEWSHAERAQQVIASLMVSFFSFFRETAMRRILLAASRLCTTC